MTLDPRLHITDMLRMLRTHHAMGLSEFSALLGVNKGNYQACEKGRIKVSFEKALHWAKVLDIDADVLLGAVARQHLEWCGKSDVWVEMHLHRLGD